MKPRLTLLFSVFFGLLWAASLPASSAKRISFDQLAKQADRVVMARLQSSQSDWGPDHRRIWTVYRFQVEQDLDGGSARELTVRHPGGTVGRLAQKVHGYPKFKRGEPVLLFLQKRGSHHRVLGLSQGVFIMHSDGERDLLVQRLEGLSFPEQPDSRPVILEKRQGLKRIRDLRNPEARP